MPLISVTRLRVRSWRYLPAFLFDAVRTARQAARSEGNLAVKVLRDAKNTWWTSTCWDSEASMRKFMLMKPHGPAMRKLLEWCDEAALVHWSQPESALPSWTEAHRRMQSEGRISKVLHPSPDHVAFRIAPPTASGRGEVRIK
ncbi:DUF3291 domain-containing protein [Occallatibacter riparius]|uniref:DUF3291 domain-containing protein n=1 Tax=Occallatibacter riparius TaxID=1002689 RepID=A0A9J7BTB7_9BACT|nr:DUF3291 domain-containing protein [Occallatibacter riparius]UWZ85879.1 DUF3291 domain-containing protein [Occallatibacter riparius]